jgi:hypothetical protein
MCANVLSEGDGEKRKKTGRVSIAFFSSVLFFTTLQACCMFCFVLHINSKQETRKGEGEEEKKKNRRWG